MLLKRVRCDYTVVYTMSDTDPSLREDAVDATNSCPDDTLNELDDLLAELESSEPHRQALEDAQEIFKVIATLREIRKTQGLKQKEVAAAMGTTQSAVSKIEGGASDPQLTTLLRYARALNTRVLLRPVIDQPRAQRLAVSGWADHAVPQRRRPRVRPAARSAVTYLATQREAA